MKGVIILPKSFKKEWTPKSTPNGLDFSGMRNSNWPFWHSVRDTFNFEMRYVDEVDVDYDTDIVFMFAVPYHARPKMIPGLLCLDKKIKLVMWAGDVQCHGNTMCREGKLNAFKRCDLIMSTSYEFFKEKYPQFMSKHCLMPKYFGPHEYYSKLILNESPIMKCMVSGHANPKFYPLRAFLIRNGGGLVVSADPIPGYTGQSYVNLLHSYFCCATSSSIYRYPLTKYYEIPATGSLLLADEPEDLKKVGFVPNKHYVPITKENALIKIRHCLENPADYIDIRKEGMRYVHENHSLKNRMQDLNKVFNALLNS